jgi:hypothetical protein
MFLIHSLTISIRLTPGVRGRGRARHRRSVVASLFYIPSSLLYIIYMSLVCVHDERNNASIPCWKTIFRLESLCSLGCLAAA